MGNLDLKNPAIQKIAVSALLAVAVLGVFFFTHFLPFGYLPRQEKLVALKAEYDQKSTELARARATVSDLPRFEAEYEKLHERWVKAAELLPTDNQVPVLLRKITLAAQQTGVEFVVFRPSESKAQDHYTELPLAVSVYGGYHQVGSFVAELANMRRIITVSGLQLKSNTKADNSTATVSAEFNASAYSLNSSAAPVPAPAPNAASGKEGGKSARKPS
jgi:type IV pilus assembly protein PilO